MLVSAALWGCGLTPGTPVLGVGLGREEKQGRACLMTPWDFNHPFWSLWPHPGEAAPRGAEQGLCHGDVQLPPRGPC